MKHRVFKKLIAFTLCLTLLASCMVFAAPAVSAETREDYTYELQMITENNADCNDNGHPVLELYGRALNGTGGEELMYQVELDYDYIQSKKTFTHSETTNKFPTRISLTIDFDGGGWRKWEGKFKITVNGTYALNDTSNRTLSGASLFSHERKNMSVDVSKGNYPAIQSLAFTKKPASTINVPRAGDAPVLSDIASELKDQYGVKWYEAPSIYLDTYYNGVSVSDGIFSVSSDANSADGANTTVKVNTTYGTFNDSLTVTLVNASYTYEFQDEEGNTISSGTLKAGQFIPKPADLSKASDKSNHYIFTGWTPSADRLTKDTVFKPAFRSEAHRFLTYTSDRNATCTKDGTKTAVCTCGMEKTITDEGSALGHSYTYAVTKEAGCTEKGIITYTCIRGDHTYTQDIDPTGHNYQSTVVAPGCEQEGYTLYTCSKCGDSYREAFTAALGHKWNSGTVSKAASCTEEGITLYTCTRCNDTYTEPIAALGHSFKTWNIQSYATCTQDGSRYSTCTRCKEVVTQVLPAFGHSWSMWEQSEAATCEAGGKESRYCMICAEQEYRDTDALGHDMVLKEKAPADGEAGMFYYECARNCGKCAVCNMDAAGTKSVGEVCTYEQLSEQTAAIPTTEFNTYTRADNSYSYINRGASLRIDKNAAADTQAMRFSASMLKPQGVEIVDFGYIYTREDYFKSLKKFVLGGDNVVATSVKNGKFSTFETQKGDVITFNVVLNIKMENWAYNYIARPYIVYQYAGETYTVYDAMYAARSVDYVAGMILNSPLESDYVKDYVAQKIVNR